MLLSRKHGIRGLIKHFIQHYHILRLTIEKAHDLRSTLSLFDRGTIFAVILNFFFYLKFRIYIPSLNLEYFLFLNFWRLKRLPCKKS